jgi:hypothetical protein
MAGLGLMVLVPQVHDLILERLAFGAALVYALVVLLFWAIPVHRAARRAVTQLEASGPDTGAGFRLKAEAIDR